MWPSLPVANHVADVANWFFIGSLVVGVVSTVLIVWMAGVKEGYWELARQGSEERIAALVSQGDQAKAQLGTAQADIAKANAQIAEANARVAEAEKQNLDLRAKIASRRVTAEQYKILVDELSKFPAPFDIVVMGDPESALFASDLLKVFADARWILEKRELPLGEIWTGLVVYQTDDPAGDRILQAFLKANLPVSVSDAAYKRPKATIIVGNKPSLF
jgi:hypothetical protein